MVKIESIITLGIVAGAGYLVYTLKNPLGDALDFVKDSALKVNEGFLIASLIYLISKFKKK
jgi:hypothetical protein